MAILTIPFVLPDAMQIARRVGALFSSFLRVSRPAPDLSRFNEDLREKIAATVAEHSRLAELARSCPALLVAIACPGDEARDQDCAREARRLVIDGRPLAEACAAAEVAFWLRRARPETFRARPPRLPDTPQIRRAICNHVPADAGAFEGGRDPWRWLDAVDVAFETGDETVALWIARTAGSKRWLWPSAVRAVALWAWYSRHAPQLVEGPGWAPDLGWQRAFELAHEWKTRRAFELFGGPPDWARVTMTQSGLEFIPLLDADAIVAEGKAMENCVATYAYLVAIGACALWRIVKDGEHIATLDIGLVCGADYVAARELYGRRNEPASRDVWRAAAVFALERADAADPALRRRADAHEKQRAWAEFCAPYWAAKGGPSAWVPSEPDANDFAA